MPWALTAFAVVSVFARSDRSALSGDPDSFMRLAVLQHQLTSGRGLAGLTDYAFPRDGAPSGMQIHWTLPFDLLVAGLAAPFAPWLGWHAALYAAAQLCPFVCLLALAAAVVALCRAVALPEVAPWAVLLLLASPLILNYARLGMANHHLLAVALGVLAVAAAVRLLRTMRRSAGAWAALWAVLSVWESVEGVLPVLVATAIVVAAAALRRDRGGLRAFALLSPALALLVLATDPPPEGRWAWSADRFSLLQATMFVAVGLAPLLAQGIARPARSPLLRLVRGGLASSAVLAVWALPAVHLARRLLPDDAGYLSYFWSQVAELRPAWSAWWVAAEATGPAALGIATAATLAFLQPRRRLLWSVVTLLLGIEALAGALSVRLALHGAVLGGVIFAAALRAAARRRTARPELALLGLCGAGIVAGAAAIVTARATPEIRDCRIGADTAAALALPPDAVVAADIWTSPELLWRTELRTVAGPYHRNWAGIIDLARIFQGVDDGEIRAILARRHARALLLCTADLQPDALADSLARRLGAGDIPPWLQPIAPVPGANPNVRLFLVEPAAP